MSGLRKKSLMLTGKNFSLIHLGWVVIVVKSMKLRGARGWRERSKIGLPLYCHSLMHRGGVKRVEE